MLNSVSRGEGACQWFCARWQAAWHSSSSYLYCTFSCGFNEVARSEGWRSGRTRWCSASVPYQTYQRSADSSVPLIGRPSWPFCSKSDGCGEQRLPGFTGKSWT